MLGSWTSRQSGDAPPETLAEDLYDQIVCRSYVRAQGVALGPLHRVLGRAKRVDPPASTPGLLRTGKSETADVRWADTPVVLGHSELYAVEHDARGRPADERRSERQARSRPLIEALEPWLGAKFDTVSQKGKLAEAIRYALSRWEGLSRFLDDGRVEPDSNVVERAIRPLALNRKNGLFAGSDAGGQHWAVLASLVETCKLNAFELQAYLADVLTRLVNHYPTAASTSCCPGTTWPKNSNCAVDVQLRSFHKAVWEFYFHHRQINNLCQPSWYNHTHQTANQHY